MARSSSRRPWCQAALLASVPPELGWRSVEGGYHAFSCRGGLHAIEQGIVLGPQIVQIVAARLHQGLELIVRDQHGAGRFMLGDRNRSAANGLFQHGAKFVLEAGGGDAGDVDQLAPAVAESERGHGGLQSSFRPFIAKLAILAKRSRGKDDHAFGRMTSRAAGVSSPITHHAFEGCKDEGRGG